MRYLVCRWFAAVVLLHGVGTSLAGVTDPSAAAPLLGKPCEALLTVQVRATQLEFARHFLTYSRTDLKQGLFQALVAFFPRTAVLFQGTPADPGKVHRASISYLLRREGHREADRTLQSIALLQALIRGEGPESFRTPIKPLDPSATDVLWLRTLVFQVLTGRDDVALDGTEFQHVDLHRLHAMIVRLIFHDQAKFDRFVAEYKIRYGEDGGNPGDISADHDIVIRDALNRYSMEMGDLGAVVPEMRGLVDRTMVREVNPGRIFQFEAPAHHLLGLSTLDADAFRFWLLKEVLDVGGARADTHPEGSFWIRPVLTNYKELGEAFKAGKINSNPASIPTYYAELLTRAGTALGMPSETPAQRARIKLARLMRLDQFEAARRPVRIEALDRAIDRLDPALRQRLEIELQLTGIGDGMALTLGYVPELAANIQNAFNIGNGLKAVEETALSQAEIVSRLDQTMDLTLQTVLRVIQGARMELKSFAKATTGEFTLELKALADLVKVQGPEALRRAEFKLRVAGSNSAEVAPVEPVVFPTPSRTESIAHKWSGPTLLAGEGGGGDAVTAALMLIDSTRDRDFGRRFTVPAIVSVRTTKMGSVGVGGVAADRRGLQDPGQKIHDGVHVVLPESKMIDPSTGRDVGRFFEGPIARALRERNLFTDVVLIEFDGDVAKLRAQYQAVADHYGIKTIVSIDTGGDKYGSGDASATADQDRITLEVAHEIANPSNGTDAARVHLVSVAGMGLDAPASAPAIYQQGWWTAWESNRVDLLDFWRSIDLEEKLEKVQKEKHYSKTQAALRRAVLGQRGLQAVALPQENVASMSNPWIPFVRIQDVTSGVVTVPAEMLFPESKEGAKK